MTQAIDDVGVLNAFVERDAEAAVRVVERDRAMFPDISVEDGIKIFLTGGMALPTKVRL